MELDFGFFLHCLKLKQKAAACKVPILIFFRKSLVFYFTDHFTIRQNGSNVPKFPNFFILTILRMSNSISNLCFPRHPFFSKEGFTEKGNEKSPEYFR